MCRYIKGCTRLYKFRGKSRAHAEFLKRFTEVGVCENALRMPIRGGIRRL